MRHERKLVSVLFCDLVGFTSRAETMDPEDVAALLAPYHARLKHELERHGGTVEKFIGDAVMALFGAPAAHEDDAERAVRAALAIREFAESEGLEVRIGVTTGEALVAFDARPELGETMATGDVINTAARLQTAAPVGGILVGGSTFRATERAIEYQPVDTVEAKGKAEPVQAWLAMAARARFGIDVAGAGRAPLIGRERELDVLVDALVRARTAREPQLVTLVGVPGIGKSRLLYELSRIVDEDAELITWRQGRSLPYGEGVAFWAFGEMVKSQAGILETDDPQVTQEKLRGVVGSLVEDEAEADWVERHLRPLVGLAADEGPSGERRDESFAAWRRFVEALADARPAVLVFEDLHWADEGLLDFVDELIDWIRDVPLLVVGTARPELLESRPGWGGGKRNAFTLSLAPLPDDDTARLIAALLERSVLPAETQAELLARASGNPLYAEEFARMHALGDGAATEVPETLQAIVAARIDALSGDEKSLLQAGAVLGKVFWTDALVTVAGTAGRELDERLLALERKEFVRRERRSAVVGQRQYAFLHALMRDVAYGQLPRAERAEKHRLAAEWIESLGRAEDHAELVAHHYAAALELARAAGSDTGALEERARLALRQAGDRAYSLGAMPAAAGFYASALELWPQDDPARARLLLDSGRVSLTAYDMRGSAEALAEARDLLLAANDVEGAAEAESLLGTNAWRGGETDAALKHIRRAVSLLEDMPPSRTKAFVLGALAGRHWLSEEFEQAAEIGQHAIRIADQVGAEEARAHALISLGGARVQLGRWDEGIADLEHAVALARELRFPVQLTRGLGTLRDLIFESGDLPRAAEITVEAIEEAERYGNAFAKRWMRGEMAFERYHAGEWEDAAALADEILDGDPWWFDSAGFELRGMIRLARADEQGALEDSAASLARARGARDPQSLFPALAVCALVQVSVGDRELASVRMDELLDLWGRSPRSNPRSTTTVELTRAALALGRESDVAAVLEPVRTRTLWTEAAYALADGSPEVAAEIFQRIGSRPSEAVARMVVGRALAADGRRAEADAHLHVAAAFWKSVGATAYLRETEVLLSAAS